MIGEIGMMGLNELMEGRFSLGISGLAEIERAQWVGDSGEETYDRDDYHHLDQGEGWLW